MKYLQVKPGFSIKKDEIIGVEDRSGGTNGYLSHIHMKNGNIHQVTMNYKALIDLLEQKDEPNINKFAQHNVS